MPAQRVLNCGVNIRLDRIDILHAQGQRLTLRRGKKRVIVAVAHTILIIAYHLLECRQPYQDLGRNCFDERERTAVARQ